MKIRNLLIYTLLGAGIGYLFYSLFTKPKPTLKPPPKPSLPKREKESIVLIKVPIPKTVGEDGLRKIINQLKPKRILPSRFPLGVNLEWDPVMLDTPIGKFVFKPPYKFIKLRTTQEVKKAIDQSQTKIKDKGIYWEVSLIILV